MSSWEPADEFSAAWSETVMWAFLRRMLFMIYFRLQHGKYLRRTLTFAVRRFESYTLYVVGVQSPMVFIDTFRRTLALV